MSTQVASVNPPSKTNILANHIYKKRKFVQSDELDNYLSSPPANIETDTLLYWKLHEKEFPNLAKMARDYLAVPGTSVPVECVFSGGTDLVSHRRCSLSPETIRVCMCLKSWWRHNN
ncbi:unnamed protein product [Rhizophagus irregularis]|nr:unnamed protein product [Rhizophagus irregularis]